MRTSLPPNIVAPTNLLGPDKKIWTIPPRFFTSLGERCGRWGAIAGFKSKTSTARWLKSEILPTFLEWGILVNYASGWLARFFSDRDLAGALHFEGSEEERRILTYKLVNPCSSYPSSSNGEETVTHYHGLYPQCLWSIADQGCLRASCDSSVGHEFTIPGVYMTPQWDYALQYAHACQFLEDGIMFKFVAEVSADAMSVLRRRTSKWGNVEMVYPEHAVTLRYIHVVIDAWVKENDTRFYSFEQELMPVGVETMPALVNRYEGQRQLPKV